jgi:uncharacterized protein (DUF111 family)
VPWIQRLANRPGTLLSVMAPAGARERLTAAIFREATTIGVDLCRQGSES